MYMCVYVKKRKQKLKKKKNRVWHLTKLKERKIFHFVRYSRDPGRLRRSSKSRDLRSRGDAGKRAPSKFRNKKGVWGETVEKRRQFHDDPARRPTAQRGTKRKTDKGCYVGIEEGES